MSICHGIINHKNCTLFSLWKGPYHELANKEDMEMLCDNSLRFDLLLSYFSEDFDQLDWLHWVSDNIGEFIKDTPVDNLLYHSDCHNDDIYIDCKYKKGYIYVGSSYKADYKDNIYIGKNDHLQIYKNYLKQEKLKALGYKNERKEYIIEKDGKKCLLVIATEYDLLENNEVIVTTKETIHDNFAQPRPMRF